MSEDLLRDFESWYAAVLAPLQPGARSKLNRQLAIALRQRQVARIRAQQNPDGSAWEPRKRPRRLRTKAGRIKRSSKMYLQLAAAKHLKIRATADEATIYYRGRDAHIARIAQYGMVAQVLPNGPRTRYPQRQLLGFSAEDRAFVRDFLIQHLQP